MNVFGAGLHWLNDLRATGARDRAIRILSWPGAHRDRRISMVLAAAISLPIGITLGHFRRGGALVTLLANATRAVPTLGS